MRTLHRKQERRRRLIVQLSVLGGAVVVIGIVALTILSMNQPAARSPLNMASDGIKIGAELEVVRTPGLRPSATPMPPEPNPVDVGDIRLYVDYLCANCGTFSLNNAEQLRTWVSSGAATLQVHPIALLTTKSAGTQYSLRAANAAACVANYSPHEFFAFHSLLLEHQPAPETPGLSDQAMIEMARTAGVEKASRIATCIETQEFKIWVEKAKSRALSQPVPGTSLDKIEGVPTILINGQLYNYTLDEETRRFNTAEFQAFVNDVLGMQFSESVKPSPSPSPSDTTRP